MISIITRRIQFRGKVNPNRKEGSGMRGGKKGDTGLRVTLLPRPPSQGGEIRGWKENMAQSPFLMGIRIRQKAKGQDLEECLEKKSPPQCSSSQYQPIETEGKNAKPAGRSISAGPTMFGLNRGSNRSSKEG